MVENDKSRDMHGVQGGAGGGGVPGGDAEVRGLPMRAAGEVADGLRAEGPGGG